MNNDGLITHDRLLELVTYDSDTGIFYFNSTRGGNHKGDVAGSLHSLGYIFLMLDRVTYTAHRLAWFYCFEEWPEKFIDHIDRNKSNNKLDNLREASREENGLNTSIRKDNKTGYKGVSFNKSRNTYIARMTVKGIKMYLGAFKTAKEAAEVIENKSRELHGEFYNENCSN